MDEEQILRNIARKCDRNVDFMGITGCFTYFFLCFRCVARYEKSLKKMIDLLKYN